MRQLVRPGVDLQLAEVQTVDLANSTVQTSMHLLHYDYLVVALGAETEVSAFIPDIN